MADFRMELKGAEELRRAMEKLGPQLTKKHLRRAIRQGISLVRDTIKLTAPQREPDGMKPRPGRLSRLVRVKPRRGKRGYLKVSLIYPTEGEPDDAKNASHWRFIEFGTRHVVANPYITRAAISNFRRILRHVIRETDRGIKVELDKLRTQA